MGREGRCGAAGGDGAEPGERLSGALFSVSGPRNSLANADVDDKPAVIDSGGTTFASGRWPLPAQACGEGTRVR